MIARPRNIAEAREFYDMISTVFANESNPTNYMMLTQAALWLQKFAVAEAKRNASAIQQTSITRLSTDEARTLQATVEHALQEQVKIN